MLKVKYLVYFLACVALVISCTSKKAALPVVKKNLPDSCSANISYSKQIVPIMVMYCGTGSASFGSCHQPGKSGSGYDFTTYANMAPYFSTIKTRINLPDGDASKMPQSLSTGPVK